MKKGDVFKFTISNGKSMFGVLTNTISKRFACNIYNYVGDACDVHEAIKSSILVYDLLLTGAEFTGKRWVLCDIYDSTNKAEIKDPYFIFGVPPSKIIKINDPTFNESLSKEQVDSLLEVHGFLSFNMPEGNELVAEEAFYYGRQYCYGKNLRDSSLEELQTFFDNTNEYMTDAQKESVLRKIAETARG